MATKVVMPKLGESVVEGTVVEWLCKEGDQVEEFDSILEVESAKVSTEVPSPASGTVLKILVEAGQTVDAGTVIAWIGEPGEEIPAGEAAKSLEKAETVKKEKPVEKEKPAAVEVPSVGRDRDLGFISPVVARLAREEQVDLYAVEGSGQGGRITKKDVLSHLKEREKSGRVEETPAWETPGEGDLFRPAELQFPDRFKKSPGKPAEPQPEKPAGVQLPREAGDRLVPLSSMRKSIAAHMVHSKQVSPHVTTVMEADLKNISAHREANKKQFEQNGIRLTYTAYFTAAAIAALKSVPMVNSSWTEDGVLVHGGIHIGLAASLGEEGLIVPVIRNADSYSLSGLAREIGRLADAARSRSLKADEVQGGTFTITNHGTAGSLFATPIINQPQCAILGVGMIQKRPVVIDDAIAIRPMVYLSLSFDHRILDGASADRFLGEIVTNLEGWRER